VDGVSETWGWLSFGALIAVLMVLDLGIVHRRGHVIPAREAALWAVGWFTLAAGFNIFVFFYRGLEPALQFTTGYLIEESLSIDNIFVFVVVLSWFRVPAAYQHRVLFWGVLGALALRAIMIGAGTVLLAEAHWVIYVFGAFLVYTAYRMARTSDVSVDPTANPVFLVARRVLPLTPEYVEDRFVAKQRDAAGRVRRLFTPLVVVLLVIESTDVVFALDSIPAIFAVTRDPFIIYTSNVFAVLGLRSLYFVLAGAVRRFAALRPALSIVLGFVGLKMLMSGWVEIPIGTSLGVVAGVLVTAVLASLWWERRGRRPN
jgi:TerC family integral membrane protein